MEFERALFRAHPEFASGRLEAQPISTHYMLVRAVPGTHSEDAGDDPIVGAYLEFVQEQMELRSELIRGLSVASLDRARALVGDVEADPNEDLGDFVTLD
jgi:hypothetical protein